MNKQQLASKIWESANKMRSKIEANEYKDYILGFIFYKFLSTKELQILENMGYPKDKLSEVTEDNYSLVESLQNKNAMVHDESLQDTLLDLFNYMMMYSCARELTPGEDTMVVKLVYKMHEEAKMILECNLEQSFIFNTLKHEMQFSYELCESIIHDLKQAFE